MCNRLCPASIFKTLSSVSAAFTRPAIFHNERTYQITPKYETSVCLTQTIVHAFSSKSAPQIGSSEHEFVASNNPNTFGRSEDYEEDGGEAAEDQCITYPSSKLRIKQYADIIKEHLRNKELAEAIDVLETRMIKQDRVKPDNYIYRLLIGACGRFGYSKKAFQLYNQMKKRALKVNDAVYTGLFNACATSPFPEDSLKRAKHLRTLMFERGIQLNDKHYNAMIKAFGRCGDLSTAFQLVDEMIDQQLRIQLETFSFLFQSCISDSEAGFRHAVLVWHKMMQRKYKPDIYIFNLMLRCVRDCGIGDVSETEKAFQQITAKHDTLSISAPSSDGSESSSLAADENYPDIFHRETEMVLVEHTNPWPPPKELNQPNLLAATPHLGSIVAIKSITQPHDRLLLLGGCTGFLKCMERFEVVPDVRTYTLLVDCIPSTIAAEKTLLSKIGKSEVNLDIDFYNMLIKKRSLRFDYESAKNVLYMIQSAKLLPDIVTFGVLALGCETEEEARELIHSMRNSGYRMNVEILGAMLKQGCHQFNFNYVAKMLYVANNEGVKPSPEFLNHIDELIEKCKGIVRLKNRGEPVPKFAENPFFRKKFTKFVYKYEAWLKEIGGRESVVHPHPWAQFRKQ